MAYKIEVDYDDVHNITVKLLKDHLDMVEATGDDPNETRDNSSLLIASLYQVIKYFSLHSEYDEWIRERKNV